MSSEDLESEIKDGLMAFKLKDSEVIPNVVDSELVSIGGWRMSIVSTIDSQASSEKATESCAHTPR